MNYFVFFLVIGVSLLFFSVVFVNQACPDDVKVCPDGSVIVRDPLGGCEFPVCPNLDLVSYCSDNVVSVDSSDGLVRTVSSLLGGGFIVYSNVSVIHCPVVAPSVMSDDCVFYSSINWSRSINCSLVSSNVSFVCPSDFFVLGDYQWVNCSLPGFGVFCDSAYEQWVEFNCGVDVIR